MSNMIVAIILVIAVLFIYSKWKKEPVKDILSDPVAALKMAGADLAKTINSSEPYYIRDASRPTSVQEERADQIRYADNGVPLVTSDDLQKMLMLGM